MGVKRFHNFLLVSCLVGLVLCSVGCGDHDTSMEDRQQIVRQLANKKAELSRAIALEERLQDVIASKEADFEELDRTRLRIEAIQTEREACENDLNQVITRIAELQREEPDEDRQRQLSLLEEARDHQKQKLKDLRQAIRNIAATYGTTSLASRQEMVRGTIDEVISKLSEVQKEIIRLKAEVEMLEGMKV